MKPNRLTPLLMIMVALADTTGCKSDGGGTQPVAGPLKVGFSYRSITPTHFEPFEDTNGNAELDEGEPGLDTGWDRLFDPQEPGYDPADPNSDPSGDNYDPLQNPTGSEGDGQVDLIYLAGFQGALLDGRGRPALGVHDEIGAHAVAMSQAVGDEERQLLLVGLDTVGLFHKYANRLRRRAEAELGIPSANVIIASLHNHEVPDTMGLWNPFSLSVQEYMDREGIMESIFEAMREAWESRVAARVTAASAFPPGCYDKETLAVKLADACRGGESFGATRAGLDAELLETDIRDPYVRDMLVVGLRFDAADGSGHLGTVVNWSAHPETLADANNQITADFPGYVRAALQREWGGRAVYFSGAVGGLLTMLRGTEVPLYDEAFQPVYSDLLDPAGQPFPALVSAATFDKARSLGAVIARTAMEALSHETPMEAPVLEIRSEEAIIPIGNPLFRTLFDLIGLDEVDKPIEEGEACQPNGCVAQTIVHASMGSWSLVTFPGEAFPEYMVGRQAVTVPFEGQPDYPFPAIEGLRDRMTQPHSMLLGLAGNELGYLVPESDYLQPGNPFIEGSPADHPNYYEESVSVGPNAGDLIHQRLMSLLAQPTETP